MNMRLRSGFTLIEIMIVVAIIAVLTVISVPNFIAYRMESQKNACIANMKAIINAEESYYIKNGKYTDDISNLAKISTGDMFLNKVPKCPCGGNYSYIEAANGQPAQVTCTGGTYKEGFEHILVSTGMSFNGE